jgi:hypothetical protein
MRFSRITVPSAEEKPPIQIEVLPVDPNPKQLRLGWVVYEEVGVGCIAESLLMPEILSYRVIMIKCPPKIVRKYNFFVRERMPSLISAMTPWRNMAVALQAPEGDILVSGWMGWAFLSKSELKTVKIVGDLGFDYKYLLSIYDRMRHVDTEAEV